MKRGGQAGVPGPPDAPGGLAPEHAGDESGGAADDADLDGGYAEPVPLRLARDEPGDIGDEGDAEQREYIAAQRRQVEVKDALDFMHGGFVGRNEERGVAGEENQGGGEDGDVRRDLS